MQDVHAVQKANEIDLASTRIRPLQSSILAPTQLFKTKLDVKINLGNKRGKNQVPQTLDAICNVGLQIASAGYTDKWINLFFKNIYG